LRKCRKNFPEGITPACAGSSACLRLTVARFEDHPRVCGEQPYNLLSNIQLMGSPPRVRGAVFSSKKYFTTLRITPACAGSST